MENRVIDNQVSSESLERITNNTVATYKLAEVLSKFIKENKVNKNKKDEDH